MRRLNKAVLAACAAAALLLGGGHVAVAAPAAPPPAPTPAAPARPRTDPASIAPDQRSAILGAGYRTSADRLWSTAGDAGGFHLLVADAADGYTWRTAATLTEPGIDTDQWIGNACLTASGDRAVVAYEPRHFANRQHLFDRGAFAAVVDIASGTVTKLDVNVSVAYYNPGCGAGETAALTQGGAADLGRTRINLLDTATRKITKRVDVPGQLTTAVPYGDRIAGATGGKVVSVDWSGTPKTLATTTGPTAFLTPDGDGGLTYLEHADDKTTAIRRIDERGGVQELGRGPLTDVGLARGARGKVFITGKPAEQGRLPSSVTAIAAPVNATVSTTGEAVLAPEAEPLPATAGGGRPVGRHATFRTTGRSADFVIDPQARTSTRMNQGRDAAPQLATARRTASRSAAAGSPTSPIESDRYCSVPRNDPGLQAEQPHWTQVEWAATLAVQNSLTVTRPAGWHGTDLAAWSPQGLYPSIGLTGGGTVPAQIMLAVLAQESNLWQASWHALEGVPGNPLVGAYYGIRDGWSINFADADCGYGVAQVTDGMRLAGRTKPGETARPYTAQKAIAVDYATNIAAGLRILQEKWNTLKGLNIVVNNGDPSRIENWFAAVWAYNSGLNPQAITGNTSGCTPGPSCTDSRGMWGLGWGNNPANPDYPYNRKPFLDGPNGNGVDGQGDAAVPQRWPYPEKIMGWAAYPIVKSDYRRPTEFSAGFNQAWWTAPGFRTSAIKPPLTAFCTTQNNCAVPSNGSGPGRCGYSDYHCWWHWSVETQPSCEERCGYANPRFAAGAPEPARGDHYPAICQRSGLPSNALVIDDVPASSPVVRSDQCGSRITNNGSFDLSFAGTAVDYPSKIDFHQLGGGVNGHMWFAHEQAPQWAPTRRVTGTWTLNQSLNKWAKVWVHLPYTFGETQQAHYRIDRGANAPAGTRYKWRVIGQYRGRSEWVSLGAFQFQGTPSVSLGNITLNGESTQGVDNIVWDAVAVQPLSAKPRNFVVAMGDSYSSGEGVVNDADTGYYPDSNHNTSPGNNAYRNGCHRSPYAWSRQAQLADDSRSIGAREDAMDTAMDYHMVACAGTQSEHMMPSEYVNPVTGTVAANPITGQLVLDPSTGKPFTNGWGEKARTGSMREVTQMDSGFLDENTTLVTLTVGGNDVGWSGVMQQCYLSLAVPDCMERDREGTDVRLRDWVPSTMELQLRPTLVTMLRAIRTMAPNARIVLMGYPKLLSKPMFCIDTGIFNISNAEVDWLNQAAVEMAALEEEITTTARANGINAWFANPIGDFEDRGICSERPALHGLEYDQGPGEKPGPLASSGFHPNQNGGVLYRNALNRTLRSMGL